MADETSQMEVERENQGVVTADQPTKTEDPQYYEGTTFGLPREWTAEIRPRKSSSKYFGKVDQFFYEPGTHRQFRSLKAAKKHLGLDVGQTSNKKKSKASKAAHQSENIHEKDGFASKAAVQSKKVDEKEKYGANRNVADADKSEEKYQYFDKIAKRVRRQFIKGEEKSWDMYIKVPNVVQQRWMNMFVQPDNNNKESTRDEVEAIVLM